MVRVVKVYYRKEKRSLLDRLVGRNNRDKRADVEKLTQEMARQREADVRETYERIRRTLLTDIISPTSVQTERDYIKIDNKYCRILAVTGFPAEVEPGWMQDLSRLFYQGEGDVFVSMHIDPIPRSEAQRMLENEYLKIDTEREKARLDGVPGDRTAGVAKKALDQDIRDIALGKGKLFYVSLYIQLTAMSLEDLDILSKRIVGKLDGLNMIADSVYMRMHEGLQSVLPAGTDVLRVKKTMTTGALAACNLFYDIGMPLEPSGVFVGVTIKGDIPVIIDPFGNNFVNPNGLVLAGSGGGKSFFVKLYAIRQLLMGVNILIVDPSQKGEYQDVTQAQQGSWIPINKDSDVRINIFDLFGGSLEDKMESLKAIAKLLIIDLSPAQASMLNKCWPAIYRARGITDDKETWKNEPPTLEDAYKWLQNRAVELKEAKDSDRLRTCNTLIDRFEDFITGTEKWLNTRSNIPSLDNRFVSFYVGGLRPEHRTLFTFLIMDYIYKRMQKGLGRKVLIMDEVWDLLRNKVASDYIMNIVRTCRKHNLGLILISQLVKDFLRDETGDAVMANTTWKLLLKQEDAARDAISNAFKSLTKEDVNWLVELPSPKLLGHSQGIFVLGGQRTRIKIFADEFEHELVSTNPEELKKTGKKLQEEQRAQDEKARGRMKKFDIDKGFFRLSELTDVETRVYMEAGYRKAMGPTLGKGRGMYYLIRPSSDANQSDKHFITAKLLEEEIRLYKPKRVKLYDVKLPDIVFTLDDGRRIAIEVETGTNLHKSKKILEEKMEILKAYDDWFFVCDDADKAAYSKWGPAYNRAEAVDKIKEYFT